MSGMRIGRPLCIELFAGCMTWSAGWLALGGYAVGFDIEHQPWHGDVPENAMLVLQDVRTLHGSQFKDASLILASPPCQEFSYMAMPWTRAKQIARALRGQGEFPAGYTGSRTIAELTALFDACFRIQREACEAAGRYIPMVVENVRGAQPWVGKARWSHGSYYLWGDVPALMPLTLRAQKFNPDGRAHPLGSWFAVADSKERGARASKNAGGSWFNVAHNTTSGHGQNPVHALAAENAGAKTLGHANRRDGHSHTRHLTNQAEHDAVKNGGDWFSAGVGMSLQRRASSKSHARRAASAAIARIPYPLSQHIASTYFPAGCAPRDARESA